MPVVGLKIKSLSWWMSWLFYPPQPRWDVVLHGVRSSHLSFPFLPTDRLLRRRKEISLSLSLSLSLSRAGGWGSLIVLRERSYLFLLREVESYCLHGKRSPQIITFWRVTKGMSNKEEKYKKGRPHFGYDPLRHASAKKYLCCSVPIIWK